MYQIQPRFYMGFSIHYEWEGPLEEALCLLEGLTYHDWRAPVGCTSLDQAILVGEHAMLARWRADSQYITDPLSPSLWERDQMGRWAAGWGCSRVWAHQSVTGVVTIWVGEFDTAVRSSGREPGEPSESRVKRLH